jgi:signal peptidase II
MKQLLTKGRISLLIVIAVLVVDQIIKVLVKTTMHLGDRIHITDWFYIYFTENNGMAFGIEIFGKLFLSCFRIIAVGGIGYYLFKIIKEKLKTGYIVCVSLILAGALGNIIDSIFYGMIFNESDYSTIATFASGSEGYAPWFYGKVVDMFYFPIIDIVCPGWMPFVGGERFIFFSPIFNFADSAITCGILVLLLFYSKFINPTPRKEHENLEK